MSASATAFARLGIQWSPCPASERGFRGWAGFLIFTKYMYFLTFIWGQSTVPFGAGDTRLCETRVLHSSYLAQISPPSLKPSYSAIIILSILPYSSIGWVYFTLIFSVSSIVSDSAQSAFSDRMHDDECKSKCWVLREFKGKNQERGIIHGMGHRGFTGYTQRPQIALRPLANHCGLNVASAEGLWDGWGIGRIFRGGARMGENIRPTVSYTGGLGAGESDSYFNKRAEPVGEETKTQALDQWKQFSHKYSMSERSWSTLWASVCLSLKAVTEAGRLPAQPADG